MLHIDHLDCLGVGLRVSHSCLESNGGKHDLTAGSHLKHTAPGQRCNPAQSCCDRAGSSAAAWPSEERNAGCKAATGRAPATQHTTIEPLLSTSGAGSFGNGSLCQEMIEVARFVTAAGSGPQVSDIHQDFSRSHCPHLLHGITRTNQQLL
uniref:Uncharacterized protein n=1 Tax=Rousettus aegyptiacus TaxID=9407 RepID=A0A7J8KB48_ROUAE|nr:hypothetical protein HJG63_007903 [Rousettus aegyptiacus]